ncbi:TPA: hypothetical protein DEP21_04640 [Patescibacteria group bacterium]|nr:hypothetical protein [Candidatus Gracilibacteria bacterium]
MVNGTPSKNQSIIQFTTISSERSSSSGSQAGFDESLHKRELENTLTILGGSLNIQLKFSAVKSVKSDSPV